MNSCKFTAPEWKNQKHWKISSKNGFKEIPRWFLVQSQSKNRHHIRHGFHVVKRTFSRNFSWQEKRQNWTLLPIRYQIYKPFECQGSRKIFCEFDLCLQILDLAFVTEILKFSPFFTENHQFCFKEASFYTHHPGKGFIHGIFKIFLVTQ